ncbi:MAG: aquaporin family protein [Acidimicrobiaceae bacterium]|jgi:glycerol uptake facilitator-like aquaporin|nr:aquaporin family protein [Acidimicrobiaceae bacterium]|tara:strand:+ start:498 stop:1172 length:675 start_codon:yes stop_codon:yes gene_type:complete
MTDLKKVLLAEGIGTMFLLIGVVGSGIMAQRLSEGEEGLILLQNAAATTAVLIAIISIFNKISADFNPAVTLAAWALGHRTRKEVLPVLVAQTGGGILGTVVANLMFDLSAISWSTTNRSGSHLWLGEVIATVGLLLVIFSLLRTSRTSKIPYVVGAYIGGAYYFTSSTSFANPAVTISRSFSDTFTGISPSHIPMFILMQLAGTAVAIALIRFLFPSNTNEKI